MRFISPKKFVISIPQNLRKKIYPPNVAATPQ